MPHNNIREKVLFWMSEKGCFTLEDISSFLSTVPKDEHNTYASVFVSLLDSSLVSSMYNVYKLKA